MVNSILLSCYCDTNNTFATCCAPYINKTQNAPTALALMRSRYTAYATHQASYLLNTTHASQRKHHHQAQILEWATSNQWLKLEIIGFSDTTVEFKAYFLDHKNQTHVHHEFSVFKQEKGIWYYVNGRFE